MLRSREELQRNSIELVRLLVVDGVSTIQHDKLGVGISAAISSPCSGGNMLSFVACTTSTGTVMAESSWSRRGKFTDPGRLPSRPLAVALTMIAARHMLWYRMRNSMSSIPPYDTPPRYACSRPRLSISCFMSSTHRSDRCGTSAGVERPQPRRS